MSIFLRAIFFLVLLSSELTPVNCVIYILVAESPYRRGAVAKICHTREVYIDVVLF